VLWLYQLAIGGDQELPHSDVYFVAIPAMPGQKGKGEVMSGQVLQAEVKRLEAEVENLVRQRVQLDQAMDEAWEQLAAAKEALITEMMKRKR
jgi:hypothetical protein